MNRQLLMLISVSNRIFSRVQMAVLNVSFSGQSVALKIVEQLMLLSDLVPIWKIDQWGTLHCPDV
jgi:hypothetical protein